MEWKTIETAPKDGTWVLTYGPNFTHNYLLDYFDQYDEEDQAWVGNPTHWMPLPEPPKKTENKP